ncbi:hypothetical protein HUT18_11750 [Streptomyces sp. NA04227]|uniref:hypothetical protein n=1 Tax=Streptomyces sp. NA04227 TaxID=2742136 RepID=UPI0015929B20|nr:hypothetical protein [Streptomyces sp. NA04227]QKW06972.1 hypothetical protein HUT18_11750 [Streptomyces sp. NA04227]
MYQVTIEHPAIEEQQFDCKDDVELRTLVFGVHRAQNQEINDYPQTIAAVDAARSQADNGGEGVLKAHAVTITVEPGDPCAFQCEGHPDDDSVLLGGPEFCDGKCRPRRRFNHKALVDLCIALDDAELDATGGCGACGLVAGQMCVDCKRCNCDRHDQCKRPAAEPAQ